MDIEHWDEEWVDEPEKPFHYQDTLGRCTTCFEIAIGLGSDGLGYCIDHLTKE